MKDAYTDLLKEYGKERAKEIEDIEAEVQASIKAVLSTEPGRYLIWWLFSITGVFLPSYTGNSDTYFNEGRRAIGLELAHRVTSVSPDMLVKMISSGEGKK